MRNIILLLLVASLESFSQKMSYPQYDIVNDTVNYILENGVLTEEKEYYKDKLAYIYMSQEDTVIYLVVSLEEKKVFLFSADSIKGYVHHDKVDFLLWREPLKGIFIPKAPPMYLTVPCIDGGPPVDGGEEWLFMINRKRKKVYKVYHKTGW